MLYRISVAECGLTGIANMFRSRLNGLDDLLRAGTVPLTDETKFCLANIITCKQTQKRWAIWANSDNSDNSDTQEV